MTWEDWSERESSGHSMANVLEGPGQWRDEDDFVDKSGVILVLLTFFEWLKKKSKQYIL